MAVVGTVEEEEASVSKLAGGNDDMLLKYQSIACATLLYFLLNAMTAWLRAMPIAMTSLTFAWSAGGSLGVVEEKELEIEVLLLPSLLSNDKLCKVAVFLAFVLARFQAYFKRKTRVRHFACFSSTRTARTQSRCTNPVPRGACATEVAVLKLFLNKVAPLFDN